jgi:hypothetical protein
MTAPFHIASNYSSLIVQSLDSKYSELLPASRVETQTEAKLLPRISRKEWGRRAGYGYFWCRLSWTGSRQAQMVGFTEHINKRMSLINRDTHYRPSEYAGHVSKTCPAPEVCFKSKSDVSNRERCVTRPSVLPVLTWPWKWFVFTHRVTPVQVHQFNNPEHFLTMGILRKKMHITLGVILYFSRSNNACTYVLHTTLDVVRRIPIVV